MKILFISRAYPPVVGGIENQNFGIGQSLSKITHTKIVANKSGKKNVPFFLLWAALKSLLILPRYDAVLFGDGVLAPLGVFFKRIWPKKKYICIVHGLDVTYAHKKSFLGRIYRAVNIPSLEKMDKLIMVGRETIAEAVKVGISNGKCVFIPNGLDPGEIYKNWTKQDLKKILDADLENKKVIFRGGRFTKHKGVEWFVRSVMPKLPENYILVVAGAGIAGHTAGDENYYPKCQKAVEDLHLENRVKLMLNLERSDIKILFNTCDLYISPNIKVPGSMEGFGITAIEAAACGRVVLASNLEGLKDAIKDGENGFLVESGNTEAWVAKINELLLNDDFRKEFGEKAKKYTIENYSWEKIAKRYLEEMEKIAK